MKNVRQAGGARLAVFAPSFPPAFLGGGPARTLDALTRAVPERFQVQVFAPDKDAGSSARLPVVSNQTTDRQGVRVFYASTDRLAGLRGMFRAARRHRPDIVYLNSLFNLKLSIIPRLLSALRYWGRVTVLVAPRGELDPGALQIRSLKKRVFLRIYRCLGLHRGVVWHASSKNEARAIRSMWGERASILVRENETLLPPNAMEPASHEGPLRAVFVSRLSPKKGLHLALAALADVDALIDFDIFGPEEDAAYVAECRSVADRVGPNVRVRFLGPVEADRVREVFNGYDVMLFPTAGENFGHVIAEALSAACPVVTTDTTPWTELLRGGAGAVIDPADREAWCATVALFGDLNPSERLAFRRAAAVTYEEWRTRTGGPHVFELLEQQRANGMIWPA